MAVSVLINVKTKNIMPIQGEMVFVRDPLSQGEKKGSKRSMQEICHHKQLQNKYQYSNLLWDLGLHPTHLFLGALM